MVGRSSLSKSETPHDLKGARIIIVSTAEREVDPRVYGGVELVVYNLADAMLKLKDIYNIEEIAVACCKRSRLPKGVTYIPTVVPKEDPNHDWIKEEEEAYNIYEPYLKDFNYIIDESWFGFPYIYKLKNPNVKVCHTFHGMPSWNSNPPISDNPNYIAVSEVQADMIFNRLGIMPTVIHHGIDTELYHPIENPSRDYYLFLNRIMREKGALEFIWLCEQAKVKGIIAGEDKFVSDKEYVERVKERAEKSDYVEYIGRVTLEKKIELLQNAKAVIAIPMPPYIEVFGLFCAEALACGTPVIALRNGGLIDQLKVPYLNALLCDSLLELLTTLIWFDSDGYMLHDWTRICRERGLDFSKEIMAKNYLDFLSHL